MIKAIKLLQLVLQGAPYLSLAYQIFKTLRKNDRRHATCKDITDAMKDGRLTRTEWTRLGTILGVK